MSTAIVEAPPPDTVPPAQPPDPPRWRPPRLGFLLPGTALNIVAAMAVGLVLHLAVVSQVQYQRNQQTAYSDFRAELARGEAPVGQYRVDYNEDPNGKRKLVSPGSPVAILEIPKLGLRQVVFEGTSGGVLRAGPGHRRDTVLPGQAGLSVIMGRHAAYGGPFRDLDLLQPGHEIFLTTGQQNPQASGAAEPADTRHRYVVTGVRRPGDPAPQPIEAGHGRLTLVTATGGSFWEFMMPKSLLMVDAELETGTVPAPPRRFGSSQLPHAEMAMKSDPSAWTPLMLWGQALLLAALAVTYLRGRLGRWHAWIIGAPVLAALGFAAADQAVRLLPNLL
jgi:sortase A